jgi:hypothetical protein
MANLRAIRQGTFEKERPCMVEIVCKKNISLKYLYYSIQFKFLN